MKDLLDDVIDYISGLLPEGVWSSIKDAVLGITLWKYSKYVLGIIVIIFALSGISYWGFSSEKDEVEETTVSYDGVYQMENTYSTYRYTVIGNSWTSFTRVDDEYRNNKGVVRGNRLVSERGDYVGEITNSRIILSSGMVINKSR
jgi:hypothetical protein